MAKSKEKAKELKCPCGKKGKKYVVVKCDSCIKVDRGDGFTPKRLL